MKVLINNQEITLYNALTVRSAWNAFASSFSITIADERFNIKVMPFDSVVILDDAGDIIFKGYVVNLEYKETPAPVLFTLTGYGLAGVLEDVNWPTDKYPLQFNNISLYDVLDIFLPEYGITFLYGEGAYFTMREKFTQVQLRPDQTLKSFINNLASQRGLFVSHNYEGQLIFTDKPVRREIKPLKQVTNKTVRYRGQKMHNPLTVLKQDNPHEGKATNPFLFGLQRPRVKLLRDGDALDVQAAAGNEMRAEMRNISLSFSTLTKYEIGDIVFSETPWGKEWFVEQVEIKGQPDSRLNYTFNCVPVSVYF